MINVVIIDSGVNLDHKLFKNSLIEAFELVGGELVKGGTDEYGHGTAISGIISRSTANTKITMIKIKDVETGIDESVLVYVLELVAKWKDVDIINLSLGVNICERYERLYNICRKLFDRGVVIVSAFDNAGSISYPAAFDIVLGVTTGQSCNRIDDFEYIDDKVVNIAAKGNIQRVAWTMPEYMVVGGNSFACAHTTAQVAKFMSEGIRTRNDILNAFKEISIKQYNKVERLKGGRKLFTIEKAALFPFNKEMHSLVRYSNLLSFEVVDIYDVKYSATVGATTCHLLKEKSVKDITVKCIEKINWEPFDTLILGHLDELSLLVNKDNLRKSIIEEAIRREKQIYSFDDVSKMGYGNHTNIYCPKINEADLPPNRFGMLYRISKPVVGVFGTSSRQGKFTLQLKLREVLQEQGYDVGQIGTEPSSLLYGMDYVFPMGYNSSVYIKEFDVVRYLNHIINNLCIKEKDIVLVGAQSGTVSYDTGNIVQYTIPQYNFLVGTQPDCVILCVNPFDEQEYIQRTVMFIESSVECKVVAFVVFPMDIKDDWSGIYGTKTLLDVGKYKKIKETLWTKFNIPVFLLGDGNDMNELVDVVINFFR